MMGPGLLPLACGPYLGLLTGAEYMPLGVFSLSGLWAGLSDGKPACLFAPSSIEDAIRAAGVLGHEGLEAVLLLHDQRPPTTLRRTQEVRIIDLWPDARDGVGIQERR
jgi:hypothetical protein